jgi:hypothetical protein
MVHVTHRAEQPFLPQISIVAGAPHGTGAAAISKRTLRLGFGRIVASEIDAPNMLVNLV